MKIASVEQTIDFLDRIPKTSQLDVADNSRTHWVPHDVARPVVIPQSQRSDPRTGRAEASAPRNQLNGTLVKTEFVLYSFLRRDSSYLKKVSPVLFPVSSLAPRESIFRKE
jgi:hypothetical protein